MQGRRLPDGHKLERAGDYAYYPDIKDWLLWLPGDSYVGSLSHDITEHEDGTITVSPSILVTEGEGRVLWHGYLEHGIWREV